MVSSQKPKPKSKPQPKKAAPKPAFVFPLWLSLLLIGSLTYISYIPTFSNFFTNWDDPAYVYENRLITDFTFAGIKHLFTVYLSGNYHPLVLLSYAIEYHFFKFDPKVYHTTNLLLHIANSMLVCTIIQRLTGNRLSGFIAGLLFGIHPLHVESVAWITERKDVLYSFFFLSAGLSWLYFKEKNQPRYYAATLILFILSCLSKGQAVALPLILFVFDFIQGRKLLEKKNILEKIPFFIIALIFGFVALSAQKTGGNIRVANNYTFFDNLVIGLYGMVFYLYKTMLPFKLSAYYPYPLKTGALLPYIYYMAAVAGLFIMAASVYASKYSQKITAGFLLFLILLLPVMQVLPVGNAIAADRYYYLSSLGVFYLAGEEFSFLFAQYKSTTHYLKYMLPLLMFGFMLFLSQTTRERVKIWNNSFSLWEDVTVNYPTAAIAYNNLANAYEKTGDYENTIKYFLLAIERDSTDPKTFNNLGNAYDKLGQYDKALAHYLHAIRLRPNDAMAYTNLGTCYYKIGKTEEAVAAHEKSISIMPTPLALSNLANAEDKLEHYDKAIEYCRRAIAMEPEYALAYNNLGVALFKKGQRQEALDNLKIAARKGYPLAQDYLRKNNIQW